MKQKKAKLKNAALQKTKKALGKKRTPGSKALPPNPYTRSPIRKREKLSGRQKELKTLEYYFRLTASGENPHLALIGHRGVGKTSLLNGAANVANDHRLLVLRIDLNESKASSSGLFWYDVCATLINQAAEVGCWGGNTGPTYGALFQMLYARHAVSGSGTSTPVGPLQLPFALACHKGGIEDFECPDALIIHDFEKTIAELSRHGYSGIALLIDEADCLGANVALLQMFRNIFQRVEHCSLVMAGTEAVFPAISIVFSPIPRQFHRIDVLPFSHWGDTMQLVLKPLPKSIRRIAPKSETIESLHALCGGDPSEMQLYCHHMYRQVEEGTSKRMALIPNVFREVLHEYRANSTANVDAVLNSIERLPDRLLFESEFLSRRALTMEENLYVEILRKELGKHAILDAEEENVIRTSLTDAYKVLFDAGITELEHTIKLAGDPLSAGFWKSFVEVQKNQRWTWDDSTYQTWVMRTIFSQHLARESGAMVALPADEPNRVIETLEQFRMGNLKAADGDTIGELLPIVLIAEISGCTFALDAVFQVVSPAGRRQVAYRFVDAGDNELNENLLRLWISEHEKILTHRNITLSITRAFKWSVPSLDELKALAVLAKYELPKSILTSRYGSAVSLFRRGEVQSAALAFEASIAEDDTPSERNNLAFCQILLHDTSAALENLESALQRKADPLFALNKGIAQFLRGNRLESVQTLNQALAWIDDPTGKVDVWQPLYVLILDAKGIVTAHAKVPLDAAVLIALANTGGTSPQMAKQRLLRFHPNKADEWNAFMRDC